MKYFIKCNCEIDAVDLLLEIDNLGMIEEFIDKDNIRKIYDYLLASSPFSADQEEYREILRKAYHFSLKVDEHFLALRAAFKLDEPELVQRAFNSCTDPLVKKQLALSLGRQRYVVECSEEELVSAMYNSRVSEFFLKLMKDLDIEKPKHPETDIYKSKNDSQIESSLYNLAMTYTNAFVNLGSGKETLMHTKEPWVAHLSKEGQFAATAGEGLVHLWNVDEGCENLTAYIDLQDSWVKAGACLGCGISNSGVWSDVDPARAILGEAIEGKDSFMKLGASMGFGIAYAGTAREDLRESLSAIITDLGIGPDTAGFAAVSLGLIFVSRSDDETINTILTAMMERPEAELDQVSSRLFGLGLALTCLGQQDKAEAVIETLRAIEHPVARYAEVAVEAASYIGSGNVLKVQDFMKKLLVHEEEGKTLPQTAAVVGLAFIAGSEKVGQEMASRLLNHILQYCDLPVKRGVPIAIAILNISNPTIQATDLLSKLAHDEDKELSLRSILSMGLIGLGTNNARISGLLKDLSNYYSKDPNHDYMTKIAQGLLSAGKGLVTANPVYSDQFLYSKAGMGSLFLIANLMLDTEINFVTKFHYSLYYLVPAIYPRWLFTLDENMENFPISVRVGQAVDTTAQVGNPRTITGFQTHQSPIVFSAGDRAEVATEEYVPVTKNLILENFVIVKKNPDFEKDKELNPRKKTSASIYF